MVRKEGNVVTVKLALVAPPGTVTLAGTLATRGSWVSILIATPPAGAAALNLTVPVDEVPPTTLVGFTVIAVSAGSVGYSVKGDDIVAPPLDTEMVTTVGWVTGAVVMLNLPIPLPAETVTTVGTVASPGLLLATCMIWSKPAGAVVTIP